MQLGDAHKGKGEADKAIAAYSKSIEINPKMLGASNNRALIYQERGELDAALADFNQALAVFPNSALVLTNRGVIYERKGNSISRSTIMIARSCLIPTISVRPA